MTYKISREEFESIQNDLHDDWIFSSHDQGYKDESLMRVIENKPYLWCAQKALQVAEYAEEINHHPRLLFGYDDEGITYLNCILSTHSENGVTEKDVALAKKIDELCRE